jgi:ribonuclease Z
MRSVFYPRLINGPFGDPALYVRLAHRGQALLFDCGALHSLAPRDALKISAVFLSHAHIDHLIGFDTLLRLFLYREGRLLVFGPDGTICRIAGRLSGYTWNLTEGYPLTLTVRELGEKDGEGREAVFRARNCFRQEDERSWTAGEFLLETSYYRVRALPLDHGDITSLAFALEEPLHVAIHKEKMEQFGYRAGPWLTGFKDALRGGLPLEAPLSVSLTNGEIAEIPLGLLAGRIAHVERGMKICYVTDASPTPDNLERIVNLSADAHLLVIEAPFAHADLSRALERNHLTAALAGDLGRRAGAARLLVFHHSPRYQDQPELLAAEAAGAFAGNLMERSGQE